MTHGRTATYWPYARLGPSGISPGMESSDRVADDFDPSTTREESKRKEERRSRRRIAHRRVAMIPYWPYTRLVIWGSSMFPRRPTGLTPGSVLLALHQERSLLIKSRW